MAWWQWALAVLFVIGLAWLIRALTFRQHRSDRRRSFVIVADAPSNSHAAPPSVWVVYNPVKAGDMSALKSEITAHAHAHGFSDPQWVETTKADPGTGQAICAADAGAELVIAAGGDGTIRAVCAGLAHTGVRMGVVPLGTGNLLARNLRIPMNIARAVEVAFRPSHMVMDIGWLRVEDEGFRADLVAEGALVVSARPSGQCVAQADEFCYVVIAGLGFDGVTMANTDPKLKKRFGWIAYVLSALKSLNVNRMRAHLQLYGAVQLPKDVGTLISGSIRRTTLVEGKEFPQNSWEHLAFQEKLSAQPKQWLNSQASQSSEISCTDPDSGTSQEATNNRTNESSDTSLLPLAARHDHEVIHAHAKTILFANCGELPFILLAPDAQVNDGLLDIVAVDTTGGLVGWADLASQIIGQGSGIPAGRLLGTGQIAFRQAQGASVHVQEPQVVQVDGDALGKAMRVSTRIDVAAVEVAVPD